MDSQKLKRNEFLKDIGFKGAALFALYCTGTSCLPADVTPSGSVSFTLDLNDSSNAALLTDGGYVIKSGVVVANIGGYFVAGSQICSHENIRKVIFRNGEFYCTEHGARFDSSGKGLNKDGSRGLIVYKVTISDTLITIS